jgi:RNA polymerase sigma-70 factor (ECF subfamily)
MHPEYEFKTIYDQYYQKIVQYLARIVGPNDAEDIAQDVFDKVSRGIKEFRGDSKLSTWIYRIATNTANDRLRSAAYKHSSKHVPIEETADLEDQSDWMTPKPTPTDQTVIRKEMSDCVVEFVDNLPPDYRTVIILSEQEGLANKEIAEILGISLENVKVRLHRARAKLKAALNEGCDFYYNEQNILVCDRKPLQILPKPPGKTSK